MRILVTGATGFLGNVLCRRLIEQRHEVMQTGSKTCNLLTFDSLKQFNGETFDQIYHLAAWTQAGDFCLYHQGEQWIINQTINTNILRWWQNKQPQAKLVTIGSSCAYDPSLPLKEENYLLGSPIESLYTYTMTKRMLYVGLMALKDQFNLNSLYLVPATLYGCNYRPKGEQKHFIFDLINKIVRGKYYGEPVILWGDGYQKRELIHVDDFVRIALQLSQKRQNEIINIGPGEEFSIRHFAKLICDKIDFDFNLIQFDTNRYVGVKSKCINVDKLRSIMPDLSLIELERGLDDTINDTVKKLERATSAK